MRALRVFALLSGVVCGSGALFSTASCDDDEATIRERVDSGPDAAVDAAPESEGGTLPCGAEIPVNYVSPAFSTNAQVELALTDHFEMIVEKMEATEKTGTGTVTAAELKAIYNDGAPSLRSLSTTPTQTILDEMFDAYGEAIGKTWTPAAADQDGGAPNAGKYEATYHFTKTGVDIREYMEKIILGGVFYNHVLSLVAGSVTEATADQMLASFGASPLLLTRTTQEAGVDANKLIAEYASKRDDKSKATPLGPYRAVKSALLKLNAAVRGGEKCNADRDAAIATYLLQWERASYGTAIYYLTASALASSDPLQGPQTLHAFGEALGFIQGFKGLPAEKRKITDANIDALLSRIGATTPYKLITPATSAEWALKLNAAVNDIAQYEGFTNEEVTSFRTNY